MPRARIGKLFHLTPLVDSLADAEYFFNAVFSPLCMMRNYSDALAPPRRDLRHRRDVDRADALPPRSGSGRRDELVPLRRAVRAAGAQHGLLRRRHRRPRASGCEAAGVRITDAGSGTTVFCHPKDTPGMLEFHPATGGIWEERRPALPRRVAGVPRRRTGQHHPLGLRAHVAHHRRRRRPRRGREVLRRACSTPVPLPDQAATIDGGTSRHVPGRRGHRGGAARARRRPTPSPRATSRGSARRSPA